MNALGYCNTEWGKNHRLACRFAAFSGAKVAEIRKNEKIENWGVDISA
jgi:hypothetical protein